MEFILGTLFFVVVVGWLDAGLPWTLGDKGK